MYSPNNYSNDGTVDAIKACSHTGWCACVKYVKEPYGLEHLGNQPQDGESGVLRASNATGGNRGTAHVSEGSRLDTTDDRLSGDAERYGPFESSSVLVFDK